MSDIKISQLDSGTTLGGTEYVPIVQNGVTVKTTAQAIANLGGGSTPTLITKNITQNGTYNASSDNADGYSSVVVNVSGGGGSSAYDLLLDKQLYSHVAAFDSIALPANYTDYSHLIMFISQEAGNQNLLKCVMPSVIKYYEDYGEVPNQLLFVIATADITESDQNIQIPILNGNKIDFGIWGQSNINNTRVLGYNYGWAWQNMYLYCYGANL